MDLYGRMPLFTVGMKMGLNMLLNIMHMVLNMVRYVSAYEKLN
jgi:hypothetical protein